MFSLLLLNDRDSRARLTPTAAAGAERQRSPTCAGLVAQVFKGI
jgi:hypothetical protein